jgi:hypothetical protein
MRSNKSWRKSMIFSQGISPPSPMRISASLIYFPLSGGTRKSRLRGPADKAEFSVKQFQRKAKEWGFVKNIPHRDMMFMATKSKRRLENDGKDTSFKRRCAAGDVQEISSEKVKSWTKRNHLVPQTGKSPDLGKRLSYES